METINPQILVVDDDISSAETFAMMIQTATQLRTSFTSDPSEAISWIKSYPISVLVYDQRMPLMSGVDLYKEALRINPGLKGIMLSGEAAPGEVATSYELGSSRYIYKLEPKHLPMAVSRAFSEAQTELYTESISSPGKVLYTETKRLFGISPKIHVTYSLTKMHHLSSSYVFTERWACVQEVNAGETKDYEETFELQEDVELKFDLQSKLSSSVKSNLLAAFKGSVAGEISAAFNSKLSIIQKKTVRRKTSCSLEPGDRDDPNRIVTRRYERAQVYNEVFCLLISTCSCCGNSEYIHIVMYIPTDRIASREVSIRANGNREIIDTGSAIYSQ